MQLSQRGIKLLEEFEGLRLEAYQDQGGVWTIGYGNTYYEDGSKVKEGDVIPQERAETLYKNILQKYEQEVSDRIGGISQNKFDAFVSFCYNLGAGNLQDVINKYKQGTLTREYWCLYSNVRINGVLTKSKGLLNRRNKEYDLFEEDEPIKPTVEPKIEKIEGVKQEVTQYNPVEEKEPLFSISKGNGVFSINTSTTKITKAVLAVVFLILALKGLVSAEVVIGALFGYGIKK